MSDNIKYDNIICDAISIIANKKIGEAPYDKTIRGVIKGKSDTDGLAYMVLGQGTSQFIAYNANPNIEYEKNDVVYILVPGNDMSRKKTIISSANDKATDYVNITYLSYDTNGPNTISVVENNPVVSIFKLNSYKQNGDRKVLYKYKREEGNLIQVDNDSAKDFISQSGAIYLGVDILMNDKWDSSQVGGNYNVVYSISFIDKQTGEEVIRDYQVGTLDVLRRNPDSLFEKTTIYKIIEDADVTNFDHVEEISIYVENYPSNDTKGKTQYNTFLDLQFSNLYLQGVKVDDKTKVGGYGLHLDVSSNKNGRTVTPDDNVVIEAQIKEIGRIINPNGKEKTVEYFWFVEDNLVVEGHEAYHPKGGKGWRCLNHKSNNKFITAGKTYVMTSQVIPDGATNYYQMISEQIRVKCVVLYGDLWLNENQDNIITIKNTSPTFKVSITSSDQTTDGENKTVYYLNHGSPNLTCNVVCNDTEMSIKDTDYLYNWTVTTGKGLLQTVTQPPKYVYENFKIFSQALLDIQQTISNIDNEDQQKNYLEKQQITLELFEEDGIKKEYTYSPEKWREQEKDFILSTYVDGNTWYKIPIKDITNVSTFTCTVQYQTVNKETGEVHIHPVGTASIDIYNKRQLEGEQNLIINNGTQVFHYDDKGLSPAAAAREKLQKIKPLTFTWLDSSGETVAQSQLNSWCWYVPINNTMITCSLVKEGTPTDENKQYYLISDISSLPYTIDDNYDPKKKNNTIKLHAKLKDNELDAYTSLTFAKDGNPGTNGTQYVTKIVPVNSSSERLYFYMSPSNTSMLYDDTGVEVTKLKFKLYSGGQALDDTEINVGETSVVWEVLKNNKNDFTFIKVTSDKDNNPSEATISVETGANLSKLNMETAPYDIVRASVKYNGFNHIAEFPIHVVNVGSQNNNSFYRMKIKPLTGFKYAVYASDGRTPDYDNTLPFEIQVERLISDGEAQYWEHIENYGNIKYMYNCTPHLSMRSWSYQTGEEEDVLYDKESYKFTNKVIIIPSDTFDGESLNESFTVAAKIDLGDNAEKILYMNVPIYLMLNRYGNAALNDWDGNSIDIDGDDGHILAPQFGAGEKDNGNLFTGVLMGAFKKPEKQDKQGNKIDAQDDVGIMAFDKGQRTVFIDSRTGKSEFGKNNAGKIVIDPSLKVNGKDAGLLYSNTYKLPDLSSHSITLKVDTYDKAEGGMLIDLSTPQIGFGNRMFYVTENGELHSAAGDIGGWKISGDALTSPKGNLKLGNENITFLNNQKEVVFSADDTGDVKIAGWTVNKDALISPKGNLKLGNEEILFKDKNGGITFNAQDGGIVTIASWNVNKDSLTSPGYTEEEKDDNGNITTARTGLKLSPDGIWFNDQFSSIKGGETKIGGWKVAKNTISNNGTTLNAADGHITTGNLYATGGQIGGITIRNKMIDGMSESGHGFQLSPGGAKFSGLQVTENGQVVARTDGGGGISGDGMRVSGSPGGSYISPGSVRSGPDDTSPTLAKYIEQLAIGSLKVTNHFNFLNRDVTWRNLELMTGLVCIKNATTGYITAIIPKVVDVFILTEATRAAEGVRKPGASSSESTSGGWVPVPQ